MLPEADDRLNRLRKGGMMRERWLGKVLPLVLKWTVTTAL